MKWIEKHKDGKSNKQSNQQAEECGKEYSQPDKRSCEACKNVGKCIHVLSTIGRFSNLADFKALVLVV